MNAVDFNIYWDSHFPDCLPVGYLLRDAYRDRWFRIHTLPESKRYPQTAVEYAEVLRRHNMLLANLFSNEQTIALLATGYSATSNPVPPEKIVSHYHPFVFVCSFPMHKEDEAEAFHRYWHIWLHLHRWRPQSLDLILNDVADNTIANVLIVAPEQDVIYHPYDGGADVILRTQAERDRWRTLYRAWRSQHPSGL